MKILFTSLRFWFWLWLSNVSMVLSQLLLTSSPSSLSDNSHRSIDYDNRLMIKVDQSSVIEKFENKSCIDKSKNECLQHLNLICDESSGQCRCPDDYPVRLSDEIPCMKYKLLGELCIHSQECQSIEHASCQTMFMFTLETLVSIPTYKQWFFYNKINNDKDISYLLNKLYGRCRCRLGYRATPDYRCVPAGNQSPFECDRNRDCFNKINDTYCDLKTSRCTCIMSHHYYDVELKQCQELHKVHGQFCLSTQDCFFDHHPSSNMECFRSQCRCSKRHYFINNTGCVRKQLCSGDYQWNSTTASCQSVSFTAVSVFTMLSKVLPILVILVILFNLIRHLQQNRQQHSSDLNGLRFDPDSGRHYYDRIDYRQLNFRPPSSLSSTRCSYINHHLRRPSSTALNRQNQSINHSLLSLPDYESAFRQSTNLTKTMNTQQQQQTSLPPPPTTTMEPKPLDDNEEHLPSYEEAVELLKKGSN